MLYTNAKIMCAAPTLSYVVSGGETEEAMEDDVIAGEAAEEDAAAGEVEDQGVALPHMLTHVQLSFIHSFSHSFIHSVFQVYA